MCFLDFRPSFDVYGLVFAGRVGDVESDCVFFCSVLDLFAWIQVDQCYLFPIWVCLEMTFILECIFRMWFKKKWAFGLVFNLILRIDAFSKGAICDWLGAKNSQSFHESWYSCSLFDCICTTPVYTAEYF